MNRKPNILLLMADQMRGDCISYAGNPDVQTPWLDTLAAQGVMFDNAYTSCPTCVPARAALFSGLSQKNHGRVGYRDGVSWRYPVTLAGQLADAGYYTQCVGKMHVHPLRNNMGFHDVELHDGYLHYYRRPETPSYENQKLADDYYYWLKTELGADADVTDTGMECNSWPARPWIYDEKYHPTNWAASRSVDFLRRRDRDKPFFLMSSFVRPHPPFDAPQWYFDLYNNKTLTPPSVGGWADPGRLKQGGHIVNSDSGPVDPELLRQARVGYYACITHLDHQIGRILQELTEQGLADNTLILFISDHGEQLGDHHFFRKSLPYQGSVRIPFIISGPERLIGKRGRRSDALVELRDVLPTLSEFAGGTVPACVDGVSAAGAARGEAAHARTYLHGEHTYGELSNHFIVTKEDKYVWFSQTGREQYFHLASDPNECDDRIGDPACEARVRELRGLLAKELEDREEGYVGEGTLVVGRETSPCLRHILREG